MKIKFILSSVLCLFFCTSAWAQIDQHSYDFIVDGISYSKNADSTSVTIAQNTVNSNLRGDVVIPARVDYAGKTYDVTTVANKAFYGCGYITSVTIPKSITSMGYLAFSSCPQLKTVTWNVESCNGFGETSSPFWGVAGIFGGTGIESFIIGDEVKTIPSYLCYGLAGITEMVIPESVQSIGHSAFSQCTALADVVIGNSVTNIDTYAFAYSTALSHLTVGKAVKSIGYRAFLGCENLTDLIWNAVDCDDFGPLNNYSAELNAPFVNCTNIKKVVFGDEVTHIPAYLCNGFVKLTDLTMPNSVVSIGERAFLGCKGLAAFDLPDHIQSVGNEAFYECSALTSLFVPESLTHIGASAFFGCTGLNSIVVADGNPVYDSRNNCNAIIETASNILLQGSNALVIPKGVEVIGESSIYGYSGLTTIRIPNSVKKIASFAFGYCDGLEKVIIPNSVDSICRYAFYGCSSLASLKIPDSVSYVGDNAFSGCTGLKSLYLGNSITEIMGYTFAGCSSLEEITLGENVKTINSQAFYLDTNITSIRCKRYRPASVLSDFAEPVYSKATLYVPKGSLNLYYAAPIWMNFDNIEEFEDSEIGDIDGSGSVNVTDVTALVNMILELTEKDDSVADVNGDGQVNVSDVTALVNIILGIH